MNKDMHLIRATELAAIATFPKIGSNNKNEVDGMAVQAMRDTLNGADIKITVVVGEGELDEAPMLYAGEVLGQGKEGCAAFDIAVDPVEGTEGCAANNEFSGAVLAASAPGTMLALPEMYMAKWFISSKWADEFKDNYEFVSAKEAFLHLQEVSGKKDLIGYCLDRDRNNDNAKFIEENGGIVKRFKNGDVLACLDCMNDKVDFVFGIGASPEGVASAALARAHGGAFFGRLKRYSDIYPDDDNTEERNKIEDETLAKMGLELEKVYSAKTLCNDPKARFVCTGITGMPDDSSTVKGIEKTKHGFRCRTVFVSHGITRYITGEYKMELVKELLPSAAKALKKA